jgi:hypothetical protein
MKDRLDYREFLEVQNTRKRLRKLLKDDRISPEFRHCITRRLDETEAAAVRLDQRAAFMKKSADLRPGIADLRPSLWRCALNRVKSFFRRVKSFFRRSPK